MEDITKQAKSKAYKLFFNRYNIALIPSINRHRKHFDLRRNIDKIAISIYKELVNTVNHKEIKAKQAQRLKARQVATSNIYENKLFLDFKSNNNLLIYSNYLTDGYRKHWAKTDQDLRVLQVLRKHYPNLSR